ncbi:unnamed protein product [Mortierella alpina]
MDDSKHDDKDEQPTDDQLGLSTAPLTPFQDDYLDDYWQGCHEVYSDAYWDQYQEDREELRKKEDRERQDEQTRKEKQEQEERERKRLEEHKRLGDLKQQEEEKRLENVTQKNQGQQEWLKQQELKRWIASKAQTAMPLERRKVTEAVPVERHPEEWGHNQQPKGVSATSAEYHASAAGVAVHQLQLSDSLRQPTRTAAVPRSVPRSVAQAVLSRSSTPASQGSRPKKRSPEVTETMQDTKVPDPPIEHKWSEKELAYIVRWWTLPENWCKYNGRKYEMQSQMRHKMRLKLCMELRRDCGRGGTTGSKLLKQAVLDICPFFDQVHDIWCRATEATNSSFMRSLTDTSHTRSVEVPSKGTKTYAPPVSHLDPTATKKFRSRPPTTPYQTPAYKVSSPTTIPSNMKGPAQTINTSAPPKDVPSKSELGTVTTVHSAAVKDSKDAMRLRLLAVEEGRQAEARALLKILHEQREKDERRLQHMEARLYEQQLSAVQRYCEIDPDYYDDAGQLRWDDRQ